MVKFSIPDEIKYFTPFTMYMEYILLKYNKFLKTHLKEEELTTKEFLYLFNIFHQKKISQKELADLMYVSEANIAKIVNKLFKKGFINKKKDENNKSRNIISLTPKGERIVYQFVKLTYQWETKVAKEYDIKNMDKFKELLYDISENSVDIS